MITGSITSTGEDSIKIYEMLTEELSKFASKIYSPIDTINFKGTNEDIYNRVMNLLPEVDLVVAEMSNPSTGQGMELQEAVRLNIPIVIIAKEGSKISGTVLGSEKIKNVLYYKNKEDIKGIFNSVLER